MDKFSLMVPNFLPSQEFFDSKKNQTCPGCGVSLAVRVVGKAVEKLLSKAVCERAAGAELFGVKTDAAMLTIKKGKSKVIICLDDEPEAKLDGAVKKQLPAIAIAEGFKYVATACSSYPFDLYDKVKKALETEGSSYIHILCPCPSGWLYSTEDTIKVGFWAVESLAFPLYEVGSGFYNLTVKVMQPRGLGEYIKAQGRFEKVTAQQLKSAGAVVEKEYKKLLENIQPA
ncbi:MAG: hypothetical protein GY868_15070 [Deltaproteobacteria bacterium]|nr:hypothetical protein [Deltaproteobacteria bacterium]